MSLISILKSSRPKGTTKPFTRASKDNCKIILTAGKMEKFVGEYQLVKQENFVEYLKSVGVPQERITEEENSKQNLSIAVNGKNITITNPIFSSDLILNEEVEKSTPKGTIKLLAKLDGDKFVVHSTTDSGSKSKRVYSISGSELTIKFADEKSTVGEAARVYKKV